MWQMCSYVLKVVKKAEQNMIEKGENKEYLPIQGLDSFRKATVDLLLGDSPAVKEVGLFRLTFCIILHELDPPQRHSIRPDNLNHSANAMLVHRTKYRYCLALWHVRQEMSL